MVFMLMIQKVVNQKKVLRIPLVLVPVVLPLLVLLAIMETPKFFCENCGCEVKRNAQFCPHCGRLFASVRCPSCNYFGTSSQFANGCPKCGYAFRQKKEKDKGKKEKSHQKKRNYKAYDDALPKWVYVLVFGILIVVIVAILFH